METEELLRDLMATAAMQGMVSCQDFMNETLKLAGSKEQACASVARWAYMQADAMLAARRVDRVDAGT